VSFRVRAATRDDADRCFEIQRDAELAANAGVFPPDRYPFPDDDIRARWQRLVEVGRVLVAGNDSRVVGMVAFSPGILDALYVAPDEWGQGVGSRLHDDAVDALLDLGPDARLWVLAENHDARRFYERRGWKLDGGKRVVPFPPYPLEVRYTTHFVNPY
jgi:GNAT superfamily N-acetyltransferase